MSSPSPKDKRLFYGSLVIAARGYIQESGRVVPRLDDIVTTLPSVSLTLRYPFEQPFNGTVTGKITLRRIISAIRVGIRHMYKDTRQQFIPGMFNMDVTGPYGRAFHDIRDLVIEIISLTEDRLEIAIGS